jgi:carboxypeptidase family protein
MSWDLRASRQGGHPSPDMRAKGGYTTLLSPSSSQPSPDLVSSPGTLLITTLAANVKPLIAAFVLCLVVPRLGLAQVPTGSISGAVQDQASAVIGGADVQAVSRATGHKRNTTTRERGEYSIPALLPGEYDVTIEAGGFERIVRAVTVEAGSTGASSMTSSEEPESAAIIPAGSRTGAGAPAGTDAPASRLPARRARGPGGL